MRTKLLSGVFFFVCIQLGEMAHAQESQELAKTTKKVSKGTDVEEEGPFSRALEKRDWQEVNKLMKSSTRHGMTEQPGQTAISGSPNSLSKGKAVFEEYCSICHGNKGNGDGAAAQHLAVKPANLQEIAKKFPDRMFFMQIAKGKGEMPSWFDMLEPAEISDVTIYIRTLTKK